MSTFSSNPSTSNCIIDISSLLSLKILSKDLQITSSVYSPECSTIRHNEFSIKFLFRRCTISVLSPKAHFSITLVNLLSSFETAKQNLNYLVQNHIRLLFYINGRNVPICVPAVIIEVFGFIAFYKL